MANVANSGGIAPKPPAPPVVVYDPDANPTYGQSKTINAQITGAGTGGTGTDANKGGAPAQILSKGLADNMNVSVGAIVPSGTVITPSTSKGMPTTIVTPEVKTPLGNYPSTTTLVTKSNDGNTVTSVTKGGLVPPIQAPPNSFIVSLPIQNINNGTWTFPAGTLLQGNGQPSTIAIVVPINAPLSHIQSALENAESLYLVNPSTAPINNQNGTWTFPAGVLKQANGQPSTVDITVPINASNDLIKSALANAESMFLVNPSMALINNQNGTETFKAGSLKQSNGQPSTVDITVPINASNDLIKSALASAEKSSIGFYKKGGVIKGKKDSAVKIIAHEGELVIPKKITNELRKLLDKDENDTKKVIRKKIRKVKSTNGKIILVHTTGEWSYHNRKKRV